MNNTREKLYKVLPIHESIKEATLTIGKGNPVPMFSWWINDWDRLAFKIKDGEKYDILEFCLEDIDYSSIRRNGKSFRMKIGHIQLRIDVIEYHHIAVVWDRGDWALCSGNWYLYIDGKDYTTKIPKQMRTEPMDTFGTYERWSFGDGYEEEWESYEDGLEEKEWIEENRKWIETLPIAEEDYPALFKEFQKSDFRPGSCGGCI